MLLSHQNSFPLMKKPLPDQFVNLPLPGRCDSTWLERRTAHTVRSIASIAGAWSEREGKRDSRRKRCQYGLGFPSRDVCRELRSCCSSLRLPKPDAEATRVFSQVPLALQGQDALPERKVPGEDFDSRASLEHQRDDGTHTNCSMV